MQMNDQIKPRAAAIRACTDELLKAHKHLSREKIAHAILQRWHDEHYATKSGWSHGIGKKSGGKPPDPNPKQGNCNAAWSAYVNGSRPQNLEGWRMAAEVLKVPLETIVELQYQQGEEAPHVVFSSAPGEAPLSRLGNLDVSAPNPKKGGNRVHTDDDREQALALSVRPIFGTQRNEDIFDPDGNLLATGDFEICYAYILIDTADPNMSVMGGVGVNTDEVSMGGITIRYLGKEDGRILFEIAACKPRTTLAGTSQTVMDLVTLDGVFHREDWIGVGIDKGGLQIVRLNINDADSDESKAAPSLRNQLKRQILGRGIDLQTEGNSLTETKLTARRYFMMRVYDESYP